MSATNRGWSAEKQKAKYHRLKSEHRCIRCTGFILPEWGDGVICPECRELRLVNESAYARKKRLARNRKRQRRYDTGKKETIRAKRA